MHVYESAKLAKEELPMSAVASFMVATMLLRKTLAGTTEGMITSLFLRLAQMIPRQETLTAIGRAAVGDAKRVKRASAPALSGSVQKGPVAGLTMTHTKT